MGPAIDTKETARKAFLSHAHADKADYVFPLAHELDKRRVSYWLDEAEIPWGERITTKINEGLERSEFVVIFLSDAFVGRNWPEAELAAALSRENAEGRTLVLPIIIGEAAQLLTRYPLLRDKRYLKWDMGASAIADELQRLASHKWSEDELNQYILEKVDLEQFPKEGWGPGRLLANRMRFDEGFYFYWNEVDATVDKYPVDSVRGYGREPLTDKDISLIRSIVIKYPRRNATSAEPLASTGRPAPPSAR
jgi:hypothetical protein